MSQKMSKCIERECARLFVQVAHLIALLAIILYLGCMDDASKEEALRSLQSTIRKLEKAAESQMQRGFPGTATVQRLAAMRIAYAVVAEQDTLQFSPAELIAANTLLLSLLPSLTRMLNKFTEGSSQHTLLVRRIKSIELALLRLDELLGKDFCQA